MDTKGLVQARGSEYGHPKQDFGRTAKLWSAYLDMPISTEDVPMLMILLKCSREKNKHKKDSIDDIQGYAETVKMLYDEA